MFKSDSSEFTFDADSHTYRIGGRVVPSVTQIVRSEFPGWMASDWYLGRGKAMHAACALLSRGKLNWATVDAEIKPRVLAWQAFLTNFEQRVEVVETPMYSRRCQFGGTPDCVFLHGSGHLTLVDMKSTVEPPVIVQLGAYSLLWAENHASKISTAFAVELRDSGTYAVGHMLTANLLRSAEQTFLAALTCFNFRQKHSLKGREE